MQMLNHPPGEPTKRTRFPFGQAVGRLLILARQAESAGAAHPGFATGAGLLFIGTLGAVNASTVRGLDFVFFYLFACALIGWIAGPRAGMMCVAGSVGLLFWVEATQGELASNPWIFAANSLLRMVAFAVITWFSARVGGESRELGQVVVQHTARLRSAVRQREETSELLNEATQLFRQVTDNITDVFWVTDPSKREVEFISPGFEQVWGRPCRDLYASPSVWIEGIYHEDKERVTRSMLTRQASGEYDEEYRVVRTDGSVHWVHDRAFPVKDTGGAVYRVVGIAEDITERKHAEQLLRAERDIGAALSSTSNLEFALERLLDIALQLESVDCGGVYLMDQRTGELHLRAHRGLSKSSVERVARYKSDAIEARLANTGKVTYLKGDQIPRSLEVLWGSEGLQALAAVPVQHKGAVLGMLNLGSFRTTEIPARTRLAIEMIAMQVAGAIARIRAEESQRRSDAHVRTVINSAPVGLVAVDAEGVITFEDGQALAAMGVKPGEHVDRPMAEVYQDYPLMLHNVQRALRGETFSSVIEFAATIFDCRFTPLRDRSQKPAGFIAVATDITERTRLQRQILEISDSEQARIGQDIHDGLCQQLIGMGFGLNALEKTLNSQQRPEANSAAKLTTLLDDAINEARRVCRGLYPIRLSTLGLEAALEEMAAGAVERYGVQCSCEAKLEAFSCDVATATHLYRIAQEALNNALKHSAATRISIRLTRGPEALVLEVGDNGKGFDYGKFRDGGMGLHTMEYRARLIGGNLRLRENANGGTLVSCLMPLTL